MTLDSVDRFFGTARGMLVKIRGTIDATNHFRSSFMATCEGTHMTCPVKALEHPARKIGKEASAI